MKLKINPYNKKFKERFENERKRILKIIKNCEIHHVGSTAIPGLGGKGIIDIMIGIKNWEESGKIIKKLKKLGFSHIYSKEKGIIFLSKNRTSSSNNIHIHIAKIGTKPYKELLYFRDYLRKNKREVKKYYNFKVKWLKESEGNRKKYKELKVEYINNILLLNK